MRARRLAVIAACAAFVIAGCGREEATDTPAASEPANAAVVETPEPTETEEPREPAPIEDFMDDDGPKDVTSHMACIGWTETVDDTELTGAPAMSIAGRAIRSDDVAMAATTTEAGIGPMITDPWGMTEVCVNHGYEPEGGSLASEYYIDSLMG